MRETAQTTAAALTTIAHCSLLQQHTLLLPTHTTAAATATPPYKLSRDTKKCDNLQQRAVASYQQSSDNN
eukprot:2136-Heterococcus_DN1.PRE.1